MTAAPPRVMHNSAFIYIATGMPTIAEGQCIPQPEIIPNTDVTVMIGSPAYIVHGHDLTITCNVINGINKHQLVS